VRGGAEYAVISTILLISIKWSAAGKPAGIDCYDDMMSVMGWDYFWREAEQIRTPLS
jgi:hypothetical protein